MWVLNEGLYVRTFLADPDLSQLMRSYAMDTKYSLHSRLCNLEQQCGRKQTGQWTPGAWVLAELRGGHFAFAMISCPCSVRKMGNSTHEITVNCPSQCLSQLIVEGMTFEMNKSTECEVCNNQNLTLGYRWDKRRSFDGPTLHICLKCTRTCLKPGPPWAWVEGRKTQHALFPCVFLSEVSHLHSSSNDFPQCLLADDNRLLNHQCL